MPFFAAEKNLCILNRQVFAMWPRLHGRSNMKMRNDGSVILLIDVHNDYQFRPLGSAICIHFSVIWSSRRWFRIIIILLVVFEVTRDYRYVL